MKSITIGLDNEVGILLSLSCDGVKTECKEVRPFEISLEKSICSETSYLIFDKKGIPFRNGEHFNSSEDLKCPNCRGLMISRAVLDKAHQLYVNGGRQDLADYLKEYGFTEVTLQRGDLVESTALSVGKPSRSENVVLMKLSKFYKEAYKKLRKASLVFVEALKKEAMKPSQRRD